MRAPPTKAGSGSGAPAPAAQTEPAAQVDAGGAPLTPAEAAAAGGGLPAQVGTAHRAAYRCNCSAGAVGLCMGRLPVPWLTVPPLTGWLCGAAPLTRPGLRRPAPTLPVWHAGTAPTAGVASHCSHRLDVMCRTGWGSGSVFSVEFGDCCQTGL